MDTNDEVIDNHDESNELSIADDLASQFDAIQGGNDDASPEPAAGAETPDRSRDEGGRFKKSEAVSEPIANPVVSENPDNAQPATIAPEIEAKGRKFGLTTEEIAEFAKASPAVQAAFERRYQQSVQGVQQYQQKADFGTAVERAIASAGSHYHEHLKQQGITPVDAIERAFKADSFLRLGNPAEKAHFLSQLAAEYNIDVRQLQPISPEQAQFNQMRYYIEQQQRQQQQYQADQQSRQNAEITSAIQAFAADPNHEHFPLVQDHMAALLQGGQAADLKSAYDQAVWANATTRAALLQKQQASAEAAAKTAAQAARTAASVNTARKPSVPSSKTVGGDLREELGSTLNSLLGN